MTQDAADNESLAVVTLWRAGWSHVQQAVLEYLLNEDFPEGTRFLWTVEMGSETEAVLEHAWQDAPARNLSLEMIVVGVGQAKTGWEKHQRVANLYNDALQGLEAKSVLLVEDDVVAQHGSFATLSREFQELPEETVALMGAYRSRAKPGYVCANQLKGGYLPWPESTGSPQEVLWMGGGFTLYQNKPLQAGLPLAPEKSGPYVSGWDVTLCRRLRSNGGKICVSRTVRTEHQCHEVMAFLSKGPPLPPSSMRWCGREFKDDAYFVASAEKEARRLIEDCGCTAESVVVDVGCGYGRLAIGLLRILPTVNYLGLDVHEGSVAWCQTNLAPMRDNFRFQHLAVKNARYNPQGQPLDASFNLPVVQESADVIYLYSVFSHTTEEDMRCYLRAFHSALEPCGKLFFTTFVGEDVPNFSVNPVDVLPGGCSGALHVVRYGRGYLWKLLEEEGWQVGEYSEGAEADGQWGLVCTRRD